MLMKFAHRYPLATPVLGLALAALGAIDLLQRNPVGGRLGAIVMAGGALLNARLVYHRLAERAEMKKQAEKSGEC